MSAAGHFANVQAALGVPPDGEPGPVTDAAYFALRDAAKKEFRGTSSTSTPSSTSLTSGPSKTFTGILDLSHGNGFDLARIKAAGFTAIIHKASESVSFVDPLYEQRKTLALSAGMMWGAYHFSSGQDGKSQAQHFLSVEDGSDPRTLLALDMEPSPGADMTVAQAEAFVSTVREKTGRWPMIYGGGGLLRDLMEGRMSATLANCPLWLCDIRPEPKTILPTWPNWTLLQYCGDGQGQEPMATPGSDGADRNAFAGTLDEMRAAWPFAK